MGKIPVRFRESDYTTYQDYCLKYYEAHDRYRRQAIRAVLELFRQGVIPVGEQDIVPARQVIATRCEEWKKEHAEDTSGRVPLCAEILVFLTDMEKIFRLVQRQGAAGNYLMVLATFSEIAAKDRESDSTAVYDIDSGAIAALADTLAMIIRDRQGSVREWRPVLKDLAAIAARYNHATTGPKFDLDILRLVAPPIVKQFDPAVEPWKILPLLPSYFGESELTVFETFLNKAEESAEIGAMAIEKPLATVAGMLAEQRGQWSRRPVPAQAAPPSPADQRAGLPALQDREQVLEIAVTPDPPKGAMFSATAAPAPEPVPARPGMPPVIPVVIGILVVMVFALGAIVLSGSFTQPGPEVKTTVTVTPTTTATATTVPVTAAPTTTKTTTPTPTPTLKSYSSADIGNHLIDIAFGPDNNIIRKPTRNVLTLSALGAYTAEDIVILNEFISHFNNYSTTSTMSYFINYNSYGDITLEFMPESSLLQINKDEPTTIVSRDPSTGYYNFIRTTDKTFISSDLKDEERKRWIIRAVLNNLGFYGESAKYPDSIFYAGGGTVSEMSPIDLKALQLMYGKKVLNGSTKSSVKSILT